MTEGHGTCGQASGGRNRPQGGRTTLNLAPVRPLWGRLERVYLLSAGSMTFGHSTSGYSHSPPLGTGGCPFVDFVCVAHEFVIFKFFTKGCCNVG